MPTLRESSLATWPANASPSAVTAMKPMPVARLLSRKTGQIAAR